MRWAILAAAVWTGAALGALAYWHRLHRRPVPEAATWANPRSRECREAIAEWDAEDHR